MKNKTQKLNKEIEEEIKKQHLKWLEKTETAVINGTEMTVLPYGYLSQSLREALTSISEQAKREELKRVAKVISNIQKEYLSGDMKEGYTGARQYDEQQGFTKAISEIQTELNIEYF